MVQYIHVNSDSGLYVIICNSGYSGRKNYSLYTRDLCASHRLLQDHVVCFTVRKSDPWLLWKNCNRYGVPLYHDYENKLAI
jgi:hypothetical protein